MYSHACVKIIGCVSDPIEGKKIIKVIATGRYQSLILKILYKAFSSIDSLYI
jgi:hypothetical protein